eukprot:s5130_g4.t1
MFLRKDRFTYEDALQIDGLDSQKGKAVELPQQPSTRWRSQEVAVRDDFGLSKTFDAVGKVTAWKLCGLQSNERIMAVLNLAMCSTVKSLKIPKKPASVRKAARLMLVDVSQNPSRSSYTKLEADSEIRHRALCSSTVLVHVGRKRIVTGREMMFLQGHPRCLQVPQQVTLHAMRKLAGQGMALPCVGTCLWSLFVAKAGALIDS